jgi:hypothetical protein
MERQNRVYSYNYRELNEDGLDNALIMTKVTLDIAKGCERCSNLIRQVLRNNGYGVNNNQSLDGYENTPCRVRPLAAVEKGGSNEIEIGRRII